MVKSSSQRLLVAKMLLISSTKRTRTPPLNLMDKNLFDFSKTRMAVKKQFKPRKILKKYFGDDYGDAKRLTAKDPALMMELYFEIAEGNKDYAFKMLEGRDLDDSQTLRNLIFSSPGFKEEEKLLDKEIDIRTNKRVVTVGVYTCKAQRCRKKRIETWYTQSRAADELQTQHFRCATCSHYWRN